MSQMCVSFIIVVSIGLLAICATAMPQQEYELVYYPPPPATPTIYHHRVRRVPSDEANARVELPQELVTPDNELIAQDTTLADNINKNGLEPEQTPNTGRFDYSLNNSIGKYLAERNLLMPKTHTSGEEDTLQQTANTGSFDYSLHSPYAKYLAERNLLMPKTHTSEEEDTFQQTANTGSFDYSLHSSFAKFLAEHNLLAQFVRKDVSSEYVD